MPVCASGHSPSRMPRVAIDYGGVLGDWDSPPNMESMRSVRAIVSDFGSENVFILSKSGERTRAATIQTLCNVEFFTFTKLLARNVLFCGMDNDGSVLISEGAMTDCWAAPRSWRYFADTGCPRVAPRGVGKGAVGRCFMLTTLLDDHPRNLSDFYDHVRLNQEMRGGDAILLLQAVFGSDVRLSSDRRHLACWTWADVQRQLGRHYVGFLKQPTVLSSALGGYSMRPLAVTHTHPPALGEESRADLERRSAFPKHKPIRDTDDSITPMVIHTQPPAISEERRADLERRSALLKRKLLGDTGDSIVPIEKKMPRAKPLPLPAPAPTGSSEPKEVESLPGARCISMSIVARGFVPTASVKQKRGAIMHSSVRLLDGQK